MFSSFIFACIFLGTTVNAFSCPENALPTPTNRKECFLFVEENQFYLEAAEVCDTKGGNLVSIHNMIDNIFITQEALKLFDKSTSGDFWFGMSNIVSGNWSWIDSSPYEFVNWKDESSLNRTDALCGAVLLETGLWIVDYCLIKKPFVCSVPVIEDVVVPPTTDLPPPPPTVTVPKTDCPESWSFYETTGFCYKVFEDADWHGAENGCVKQGAHLASIHSLEEAMFVGILAYIPGAEKCDGLKQAWVGLYSNDNGISWQWTDATPFGYKKWGESQPDFPETQHCVQMYSSSNQCKWHVGDFDNFDCYSKLSSYVCKKAPTF